LEKLKQAYAIINKQKERMQEELNVGRDIQLGMLPQIFPPFPDQNEFSIHASMNAAREVGGDFYDFFFIDKDHLCFCVGDVSGKGVPAALFMAISKAMIKSRAADDLSTASVFTHVNEELAADNDSMMFVTVFIAVLDIRTGDLSYTNGGHNPPYIKRANGDIIRLDQRHGPALGPIEGVTYKENTDRMEKGDLLLLYTDGVTEAMNPERAMYEEDRLVNVLAGGNYIEPDQVINAIATDIKKFTKGAEQFDDITMLAISFHKVAVEGVVKSFKTVIKNQLSEMGTVLADFDTFVDHDEIPSGPAQKIKLAFDELLNNTISYGFSDDEEHEIMVVVERSEDRLLATITDDGVPFNPFHSEKPDLESSLEERQVGGLGIHLVRNLMDDVSYKRGIDKNIVTLIKYLDS
jgi:sigma-B regulation protein RsbU (phosphoserine phosphatase)